ncbi:hypothetical protein KC19_8G053000 [Ceratodon purpureus]|uniref:Uncharacterized protein n=1 Tax=Ceratodon purpureus TaxID=3225 RepID=A0A8T0GZ29_CERPU|nr:hypothetical protein KC19_8G053000 [Ceratodon purpureus]
MVHPAHATREAHLYSASKQISAAISPGLLDSVLESGSLPLDHFHLCRWFGALKICLLLRSCTSVTLTCTLFRSEKG